MLECPLYEGLREPLDRAMREHTVLVLDAENGYAMTPLEALRCRGLRSPLPLLIELIEGRFWAGEG